MDRNIHGLEPTPAIAFRRMEGIEREAYQAKLRLEGQLNRAMLKKLELEADIQDLRKKLDAVNRSVPKFGREIE